MEKTVLTFLGIIAVTMSLMMAGCSKDCDHENSAGETSVDEYVRLSHYYFAAGKNKTTFYLEVYSNTEWTISSSTEWVSLPEEFLDTHNSGNQSVKTVIDANSSGSQRNSTVTVTFFHSDGSREKTTLLIIQGS